MELDRVYLIILAVLVVAFLCLCALYAAYLVQQKVSSIAVTSADVAFFPVRATALAIRCFFRANVLCFDLALCGLRWTLQAVKLGLACLETVLLVWRLPVVLMISLLQRVSRLRRSGGSQKVGGNGQSAVALAGRNGGGAAEGPVGVPPGEKAGTPPAEDPAEGAFRRALKNIRRAKKLLRPDLLAVQSIVDAKNYLRVRAGLEVQAPKH